MQTKEKISRLKLSAAAERLGLTKPTLETMLSRGLFTVQQDVPSGDRYMLSDELDFYIEAIGSPEERAERLRDFRLRKGRIKK